MVYILFCVYPMGAVVFSFCGCGSAALNCFHRVRVFNLAGPSVFICLAVASMIKVSSFKLQLTTCY